MLAKTRLHRYGTRAYAKMRKVKWSKDFHQKLCEKYGEDFAENRPTRYGVTKWYITLEKNGKKRSVRVESALHKKPDLDRDTLEAAKAAQREMRESGWKIIDAYYRGREYVYVKEPQKEITEIPQPQPTVKVKETLQEKSDRIAKSMRAAGASWKDIAEVLKEVGL